MGSPVKSIVSSIRERMRSRDKEGVVYSPQELKENQFGLPLQHYAQQYLFGATGLRLKVFHSIAGIPQSCKSPFLFDLMGHICAPLEQGGLGGIGVIYELEDKISPVLLNSVLLNHAENLDDIAIEIIKDRTIEEAFLHLEREFIPAYSEAVPSCSIPAVVGFDSIGGAASSDVVAKIKAEGVAGKGFYNKAHYMKYWCENGAKVIGDIPMIIICVNQEKERAAATPYGAPQKQVTGGVSQVYKDGHMISTSFKTLASGDGKIITMRTTKTSFSDSRKIEVAFRWNKFGTSEKDAYGHHFDWALASAKCLADPEKGVGEIRDICDVKVSDKNLVTCPQLSCTSVPPEEFEAALFAEENKKVLDALRVYQKIDVLKDMDDYVKWLKRTSTKEKPASADKPAKGRKAASKGTTKTPAAEDPQKEEVLSCETGGVDASAEFNVSL